MRLTATCPNDMTLHQFHRGGLPDDAAVRIASHLGGCKDCAGRVERLRVSDSLVGALRNPPTPLSAPDQARVESLLSFPPADEDSDLTSRPGYTMSIAGAKSETPADGTNKPRAGWEIGRLGQYALVRVLGSGGMGTVYEAVDTQLHRRVAVKVMNPSVSRSPIARQRFLREARATAAVRTNHIITVYQAGEVNKALYLAMELLDGESLQDRCIRDGAVPVRDAVRIARETASGLAVAHSKGLIHRDIKPANIWLEAPNGAVKILDFGLVRPVDATDLRLTPDGIGVGTPGYVAPEQVQGKAVDGRADLFSLGCVLYRMVTGRPPFNGNTILEVLTSLAVDTPPRPRTVNPAVPAEVDAFIVKLMAKRPEHRPATASVVAERLASIERIISAGTVSAPVIDLRPTTVGRRVWLRAGLTAGAIFGVAAAAGAIVAAFR